MDAALAETDGGVERGEATETDGDGRQRSARPEGAIFVLEDRDEIGGHNDSLQSSVDSCQLADRAEEGIGRKELAVANGKPPLYTKRVIFEERS